MQLRERRAFLGLWLHAPSVCPWGAVLVNAGALQERDMEIQTDWLRAAPFLGPAWGAEGWKASLLPPWSSCTALQGWKLALEAGGNMFRLWCGAVLLPDCPETNCPTEAWIGAGLAEL